MSREPTLVGAMALFVSLNSFSQAIPQISVVEFKNLRDEAKGMIKNFELKKDIGDVGAPDYKFVRERMRSILDKKPVELEKFLIAFNDTIADDYNIIQSVKDLGNTKAIKKTRDIIVKVPCTDEQITNPDISRTTSKGVIKK